MTTPADFEAYWLGRGGEQWCAVDGERVVGSHTLRANHPGRGAHVGTASYVVATAARGAGVGRRLGEHSLERARATGFAAMQFNFGVAASTAACGSGSSSASASSLVSRRPSTTPGSDGPMR